MGDLKIIRLTPPKQKSSKQNKSKPKQEEIPEWQELGFNNEYDYKRYLERQYKENIQQMAEDLKQYSTLNTQATIPQDANLEGVAENAYNKLSSAAKLLNPFQWVTDVDDYLKSGRSNLGLEQESPSYYDIAKNVALKQVERFGDAASFLNFASPSQWWGAAKDAQKYGFNFGRMGNSILNGNMGFLDPDKEYAWWEPLVYNGIADIAITSPELIANLGKTGLSWLDDISKNITPPTAPAVATVGGDVFPTAIKITIPDVSFAPVGLNGASTIPRLAETGERLMFNNVANDITNNVVNDVVETNSFFAKYPKLLELEKIVEAKKMYNSPVAQWLNNMKIYGVPEKLEEINTALTQGKTALQVVKPYAESILPKLKPGTSSVRIAESIAKNNSKLISKHNKISDIQWDAQEWFTSGGRSKTGPAKYTPEDVTTWENHVANEYIPLQEKLINEGSLRKSTDGKYWEGLIDGNYVKVNPQEYIVSNSKAFKNSGLYYDGQSFYTGVPAHHMDSFVENGGIAIDNWASDNPAVGNVYQYLDENGNYGSTKGGLFNIVSTKKPSVTVDGTGQRSNSFFKVPIDEYVSTRSGLQNQEVGDFLNYLDELSTKYSVNPNIGNTRVFMPGTQVKALRGNNGNFNMEYGSPFAQVWEEKINNPILNEEYYA